MTKSTDQTKLVRDALTTIKDPETGRALGKQIHDVKADGTSISAQIGLTSFCWPLQEDFHAEIVNCLRSKFPEVKDVSVEIVRP